MDSIIEYKLVTFVLNNKVLSKIISALCTYSPYMLGLIYIPTGIYSGLFLGSKFLSIAILPFITIIIASYLRRLFNKKRPFEEFNISPLVSHSRGNSFPSKHSSVSLSLAIGIFRVNFYLGIASFILVFIISFTRILCGLHYIKDVIVGYLLGIGIWIIYFLVF